MNTLTVMPQFSTPDSENGRDADFPEAGVGKALSFQALSKAIRSIERGHLKADATGLVLPFGVPAIDQILAGGLAQTALHEIVAASETEVSAATAFTLPLAARACGTRPVLWIVEDRVLVESGAPYGPGLDAMGLRPEQLVIVKAARPRDVLWAMEEALHCRALGAVIGEVRKNNAVDAVASRRLSLAAGKQARLALLLRASPDGERAAVATRWIIAAASSAKRAYGTGPPALHVQLVRNRNGRSGAWVLEWNRDAQRFKLSAHSQFMASAAADGPRAAETAA